MFIIYLQINFQKGIDKPHNLWYNIGTEREREDIKMTIKELQIQEEELRTKLGEVYATIYNNCIKDNRIINGEMCPTIEEERAYQTVAAEFRKCSDELAKAEQEKAEKEYKEKCLAKGTTPEKERAKKQQKALKRKIQKLKKEITYFEKELTETEKTLGLLERG